MVTPYELDGIMGASCCGIICGELGMCSNYFLPINASIRDVILFPLMRPERPRGEL
jgi:hypothetical protein